MVVECSIRSLPLAVLQWSDVPRLVKLYRHSNSSALDCWQLHRQKVRDAVCRVDFRHSCKQVRELSIFVLGCSSSQKWKQHLRRPFAELWVSPLLFAKCDWDQVIKRATNAATVCSLIMPKVDIYVFPEPGQQHQSIKIPHAVTPGFRARQLQRLTAIRLYLGRDPLRPCALQDIFGKFFLTQKRQTSHLQVVVSTMMFFAAASSRPFCSPAST